MTRVDEKMEEKKARDGSTHHPARATNGGLSKSFLVDCLEPGRKPTPPGCRSGDVVADCYRSGHDLECQRQLAKPVDERSSPPDTKVARVPTQTRASSRLCCDRWCVLLRILHIITLVLTNQRPIGKQRIPCTGIEATSKTGAPHDDDDDKDGEDGG